MSQVALGLALLAGVVLVWPPGTAHHLTRLRSNGRPAGSSPATGSFWLSGPAVSILRWSTRSALRAGTSGSSPRAAVAGGAAAVAAAVGLAAGWAPGLAAGVAAATGLHLFLRALGERHERRRFEGVTEAVAALTAELRVGQSVSTALAGLAGSAHPQVADALRAAAATVALGGSIPAVLAEHADSTAGGRAVGRGRGLHRRFRRHDAGTRTDASDEVRPASATALRRLAGAWRLCERSGASLADVLDALESDLRARRAHERLLAGLLAGPKATAVLLAGLPAFGLVMGSAMGADPWHVLTETPIGKIVLVVGVGLEALGLAWTARIVAGVRRS